MATEKTVHEYAILDNGRAWNVYPVVDGKTRKAIKLGNFPYETSEWASIDRELAARNSFLFVEALTKYANEHRDE